MYPITSIFRTDRGLIPGYGLAPAVCGCYELRTPTLIYSADKLLTISRVEVVGPAPSIIFSTRRGYCGIREDMYQGEPVFSIDNFPLRLIEPEATLSNAAVADLAFRAATATCSLRLQAINRKVRGMDFLEFRTHPVIGPEYARSHLYICNFSTLTNAQTYMWLYHFLVVMYRLGDMRMPRNSSFVHLYMRHIWWRDMVLMLFKHLNVDFSAEYGPSMTTVRFGRVELRRMLTRLLSVCFPKVVDDFSFIDAVTTKDTVILDSNGVVTLNEEHDVPSVLQRTRLRGKYLEYVGLHITFPELSEFVETNGLIL